MALIIPIPPKPELNKFIKANSDSASMSEDTGDKGGANCVLDKRGDPIICKYCGSGMVKVRMIVTNYQQYSQRAKRWVEMKQLPVDVERNYRSLTTFCPTCDETAWEEWMYLI